MSVALSERLSEEQVEEIRQARLTEQPWSALARRLGWRDPEQLRKAYQTKCRYRVGYESAKGLKASPIERALEAQLTDAQLRRALDALSEGATLEELCELHLVPRNRLDRALRDYRKRHGIVSSLARVGPRRPAVRTG